MKMHELVQAAREKRSYADLADESVGFDPRGIGIGTTRWGQYGTDGGMGTDPPKTASIITIAATLDVPLQTVWDTIGETLGFTDGVGENIASMLPLKLIRRLKPRHLRQLRALIKEMAEDAEREDRIAELEEQLAEARPVKRAARR